MIRSCDILRVLMAMLAFGYAIVTVEAVQACAPSAAMAMSGQTRSGDCGNERGKLGDCSQKCAPLCAAAIAGRLDFQPMRKVMAVTETRDPDTFVTRSQGPEPPPPRLG